MYSHLLVPTDGTDISVENVSGAVEFARGIGARITFFHANADYAASGDGALMRAISPSLFVEKAAGHARAILAKAEAAARAAGVPCHCVSRISDRPAEAILEAADEESCDLIFMASRGPTAFGGIMLGSQTLKVLSGAKVPVLVSQITRNAASPKRDSAIAIIQDEHRSIAAVVHALQFIVSQTRIGAAPLDTRLMRGAIHYLRTFPEALHHPKEETYLFDRVRERSPDLGPVLDELQRQHAEGAALLRALDQAVDAYDAQGPNAPAQLEEALDTFANAQWQHMATEEKVVLPAAREHLTPEDWITVADAFGRNGDPRFNVESDVGFKNLFARIMNLAPSTSHHS